MRRLTPEQATLPVAVCGVFLVVFDTTVVNVALNDIGSDLDVGVSSLQWVIDAYTLTFAALLLSVGGLSDRIGANVVFARGLQVFLLSSVLCAVAPTLELLVAARILQGASAALMTPSSLAIIAQAYPDPADRAKAIAAWTMVGGMAVVLGPVLGGLMIDGWSWRLIFLVNVPVCLVGLVLLTYVKASPTRPAHLDIPGQILGALALAMLTFGVIEGGHDGFGEPYVIGSIAVSIVLAGTFAWHELRVEHPLVPLRLLRPPPAMAGVLNVFSVYIGFYGIVFVLALFFQRTLDHSPTTTGLFFLPMSIGLLAATLWAGRLVPKIGIWAPLCAGQIVAAGALFGLLTIDGDSETWQIFLAIAELGVGAGMCAPPLPLTLMNVLPVEQAGVASALFNTLRQVAAGIGVAVFGTLLAGDRGLVYGMHVSAAIGGVLFVVSSLATLIWVRPRT